MIVFNADGSETITFLGNSAFFIQRGSQVLFLLSSGRFVTVAASPTAVGTLVSAAGRETNICSLLS
jgi:hypothetical protein